MASWAEDQERGQRFDDLLREEPEYLRRIPGVPDRIDRKCPRANELTGPIENEEHEAHEWHDLFDQHGTIYYCPGWRNAG